MATDQNIVCAETLWRSESYARVDCREWQAEKFLTAGYWISGTQFYNKDPSRTEACSIPVVLG